MLIKKLMFILWQMYIIHILRTSSLLKLLDLAALNTYIWEMNLIRNGVKFEFNFATSEGKI